MRAFLLPLLLAAGCSDTTFFVPNDNGQVPAPGAISGRVCDPSGRTWLPDAMVYTHVYNTDGEMYDTRTAYSDRDGYWLLDNLPEGQTYVVYVQYRSQIIETHEVWLDSGELVELEEPECFDPLSVNVAVVTGDYDDFQTVLSNMGFANFALVDGKNPGDLLDFLLSPEAMAQYDIIFFNGGHEEEDIIYDTDGTDTNGVVYEVRQNIYDYVHAGGSIYASDWAYDVVEQIWPDRINFVGDDTIPNDAQLGDYDLVSAAVSDSALADYLGTDHVEIEYDLPVWPPIENVDGTVSVHLSGTVDYREGEAEYTLATSPLLVSFTSGEGKVVFSTFRVVRNGTDEMMMTLQYMMYNL